LKTQLKIAIESQTIYVDKVWILKVGRHAFHFNWLNFATVSVSAVKTAATAE